LSSTPRFGFTGVPTVRAGAFCFRGGWGGIKTLPFLGRGCLTPPPQKKNRFPGGRRGGPPPNPRPGQCQIKPVFFLGFHLPGFFSKASLCALLCASRKAFCARVVPRQFFKKWSKSTTIQLFSGRFSLIFLLFSVEIRFFELQKKHLMAKKHLF
jgi:hypothetical protein